MEESFYDKVFYEETATNSRKTWAYYKYNQTGSFATALCHAYELADLNNRRRLDMAFPRLFNTARTWMYSDNPDGYLKDILNEGDK